MAVSDSFPRFSANEFARRITATRGAMASAGIDLLFIVDHPNLVWLTGYTAESAYVAQSLALGIDEDEPLLCVRAQDGPAAKFQSFMKAERILPFPEILIANPEANGYDHMVSALRDAGRVRGRIGVEFDALSHTDMKHLIRLFEGAELVDATNLISWLRLRKSDEELRVMEAAARISDASMQAAINAIGPGAREADAVAATAQRLVLGVDDCEGTQLAGIAFCSTPMTGTSHVQWSNKVYAKGDQVNIELGGMVRRYCAGLMRTVHVGSPPDRLRRLHDAEVEGLSDALAAAKVGATCGDVATAFLRTLGRHGFEKKSRCGYAIGINWTEVTASLKPEDHTVLEPGMTFHLMLGNWIEDDFGYVISETFVVEQNCGRALGALPRELFVRD